MPATKTCPAEGELRQVVLGQSAPEDEERLAQHLEQCSPCARTVEQLLSGDTLLDALGKAGSAAGVVSGDASSGETSKLVARVKSAVEAARTQAVHESGTIAPPASDTASGEADASSRESVTLPPAAGESPQPTAAQIYGFLAPPQAADEIGRLGPYRVLKVLGEGGMGVVFQAEDPRLGRMCAVKAMLPGMAQRQGIKERFLREARAAAQVESDYIIPIYQVDEDRGVPYIAMPFLKGTSLEAWLRRREKPDNRQPPKLAEILKLAREIARGLAAAHDKGLVHRDIKPDNIWLDGSAGGRVKILDFGVARLKQVQGEQHLTQDGAIMGTPAYMAPEQAGGKNIDGRADLFSLGVVMYRLCTGTLPFRGTDLISTLIAGAMHDPPPPCEVDPSIPRTLSDAVMKLLAKDPAQRTASAKEFLAAIHGLEKETSTAVPPVGPACRAGLDPVVDPTFKAGLALTAAPNEARPSADSGPARQAGPTGAWRIPPRWRVPALVAAAAGAAALLLWAGILIFWQTDEGTVRVEINDPDIKATVAGTELSVQGVGDHPLTLSPGPHGLHIKHGELEFNTDTFTLADGETVRLKIELLDGQVQVVREGGQVIGQARRPWHGWPADAPPPAIAPFDTEQAKAHQEAWAEYLGVPIEYENSIGMTFVLIPPGVFLMGSTPEEIEEAIKVAGEEKDFWRVYITTEAPQHQVILTQPMYLGVHEVTQRDYEAVMGTNPAFHSATGGDKEFFAGRETASHPVEMVNWTDATDFCAKLSERERLRPFEVELRSGESVLNDGTGYRLPTEAEWEFACRAGTTTRFWIGDKQENLLRVGWWFQTSALRSHTVGELKANPLGLFDIHGNVCEWVQDGWEPTYFGDFAEKPAIDPGGAIPTSGARVIRGGAYCHPDYVCRSSNRFASGTSSRMAFIGFRVALSVEAVKAGIAKRTTPPGNATSAWQGWPADAPPPAIAPFDAEQAKAHQQAWADYLGVPVQYENSMGMKFALIPPGEFLMGSTPAEIEAALKVAGDDNYWQECIKSEAPRHKVILTRPVYLGVHEVTQAQYEQVMGPNPSHFAAAGPGKDAVVGLDTSTHPVERVSWNDAAEFCAKLSEKERLKPFYVRSGETVTMLDGTGYRLPTEAQSEFACCAGTTTRYWIGDQDEALHAAGWFYANCGGRTHAVGELKANPFGLFDIHGNVWEWVQDWWEASYYAQFQEQPALNPGGPSSPASQRVLRGGDWHGLASLCRASGRSSFDPASRAYGFGFRVALAVDAVKQESPSTIKPRPPVAGTWHGWPADAPPPAIAPFDAEQAKAHQAAWATHLGVPVEYKNNIGMKFVLIPPGEFLMGSTAPEIEAALQVAGKDEYWKEHIRSEAPQHKVILTQPIYFGVHEVTQAQYEQVMGQNPSEFSATGPGRDAVLGLDTSTHPVERVIWNDASEFCARLSEKQQFKPFYFQSSETETMLEGTGYRLPTEAEWEFACRAGTTTNYWTGDTGEGLLQAAWWGSWPVPNKGGSNSGGRTHAVGGLKANPFGLYDIHGNVWEWVQDWWAPTYYEQFKDKPAIDPIVRSSAVSRRVLRGGGWSRNAPHCRASDRLAHPPATRYGSIGFRVVLTVEAVRQAHKNGDPAAATAPNQVVDLLKLVDVDRDSVKGKWTLTADGLASDGSVPYCRLKLPYDPPAEYDFRIEFTAKGGNDILQLLSGGGKSFTWLMGAWGGRHDGFDAVAGHPLLREGTNIIGGPTHVRRGQRHSSVIQVRKDSIAAQIDGQLVVRHATDFSDLSIPDPWSIGVGTIGLGTTFDSVLFHKVEIIVPQAAAGP